MFDERVHFKRLQEIEASPRSYLILQIAVSRLFEMARLKSLQFTIKLLIFFNSSNFNFNFRFNFDLIFSKIKIIFLNVFLKFGIFLLKTFFAKVCTSFLALFLKQVFSKF